ncbi:glycosyltransferase family protein [Anoxybacillus sp. LAT_35]|uniref:cytidylyltransferase domain-containing protein n=1 Tax=unclassified Anoxybacillus TaxID=2639704 RepID=UPI001ED9CA75|nr:glycosyltransferase family protein [Anoxybacillus sp. LAT27]MCG5026686.1 glycosyltransferase family protein [Anoxybacillus flavithermus]MCG6172600.1 glycosyltransferase family protein [Anoxybacillus sp. LAT_11]MCG6174532.1 glycosyltransferase family protein [Anoxybacillus sp. LAT_31]MCG6178949.1 glycosyltransferase family protein [Anoxybacillus sp. LAT_35]MCG6180959.1 glycosyltransferase family protein [Anoxybacillus sp. LAT_33]
MKVAAIIQARMGSTRLPGKVLKKVLGKTLLEYQIERVKRAKAIDEIIIATTTKESDDPIVQLCQQLSIPYYRGSEEDVLSRYYEAATKFNVDVVVRLTSDCPIIDPNVIDKVVEHYLENKDRYDYVSNTLTRTYPRGMDTEVMPYKILKRAHEEAKEITFREHVTAYIYHHPNQFRLCNISNEKDESKHRWTVDTEEDFILIKNILETLYSINPLFTLEDVIRILQDKPEWVEINAHIEQKKL